MGCCSSFLRGKSRNWLACIANTTCPYLTLCTSPLLSLGRDYCDILIQASLFRLTAVCQVAMSAHCSCPSHSPDQIFYKVRHHRACCEHLQRGHVQKYLCQLEQMFMKLESESRFKYVFRKDHEDCHIPRSW